MIDLTTSYQNFNIEETETLGRVLRKLTTKGFISEKVYSPQIRTMSYNRDFKFILNYEDFIKDYLSIMNIDFICDKVNGIYLAKKFNNSSIKDLDKLTSLFLLLIRLIYTKKMTEASMQSDISVTLEEIIDEGFSHGTIIDSPKIYSLENSLKILTQYEILFKAAGAYRDLSAKYFISPAILHIINSEVALAILKEYETTSEKDESILTYNEDTISDLNEEEGSFVNENSY